MSFSSRRRNYLLMPHRRDALIEWMKSMLMHSFVLDALEDTGADTFSHFEALIDEHRRFELEGTVRPSRLKLLVPTVGAFHTRLPLRQAFEVYNEKHRLTKRKHIQISFNEIRHILNLAQIMAMRSEIDMNVEEEHDFAHGSSTDLPQMGETLPVGQLNGPKMITFDGDQTLYSDGANFDSNPRLANYLYLLLKHGVNVAIVTAAGYEYNVDKYEFRLSGLLSYFKSKSLTEEECERFYLFGGECNYLLHLGKDYHLHPVKETGPGGWMTATKHLEEAPANWAEADIKDMLDTAENAVKDALEDLQMKGRLIRKKRSIGLVPAQAGAEIPREVLDETVLRCHKQLSMMNNGTGPNLPFCAFNGGSDAWVDVGNKRVGVELLGSFLGIESAEILHIGDQFLNTGNDYAARAVCPCIWITNPQETTYILKTILRLAGIHYHLDNEKETVAILSGKAIQKNRSSAVNFEEMERRTKAVQEMDVYTGEVINKEK